MKFQAPKGTEDILPADSARWRWLEQHFQRVCSLYGYGEIRTPVFEDTALFERGIGEGTDIVHKEMYTFLDRGERSITLKPEGTAPAIRAYIEHSLGAPGVITRLYYITPVYRYERPQKGRLREHHQCGVELLGSSSPDADAEVIDLTVRFYRAIGLGSLSVRLNSLGNDECRAAYRSALLEFARPALLALPAEFRARCEQNPLRMLDAKDETLREVMVSAPKIQDFLEPESKAHFETLQKRLTTLRIPFELDSRLVRGLDYYSKTVFEVQTESLGAQNALCGGGRYDALVERVGGSPTPAVGVGLGIERALMLLEANAALPPDEKTTTAFLVALTDNRTAICEQLKLLRDSGVAVESDPEFRSAKSQFRQADKSGAKFAVVIGDDELSTKIATIKELATGSEQKVPFEQVASLLTRSGPQ